MTYTFKCDNGHLKDVEAPITEGPPKKVICEVCHKEMHRVWGASIRIPEYMKATSEGDLHTTISERMKHPARPTGKNKIYY